MAKTVLLDFTSTKQSTYIDLQARMARRGVVINRYAFNSTPEGARLASAHFAVILNEGDPFDLHWRATDDRKAACHRVETGQFHIAPAMMPLDVAWEGRRPGGVIAFAQEFFHSVAEELFNGKIPHIRAQAARSDPIVQHLCSTLCGKIGRREPHIAMCAERIAAMLAGHLMATFGEGTRPPQPPKGGLTLAQQRRVITYIEEHIGEDICLADLASEAGLSRHHFCRAFKQSVGETPCRYAHFRLMHEAKRQLVTNRKTVTKIAHELGFSSSNHFASAFRRHTGMSPTEFRRHHA